MSATVVQTKERPIIFSAEMVRAILDGRKTQTRRIVRLPTQWSFPPAQFVDGGINRWGCDPSERIKCPFGVPGDRLWVRERIDNRPEHGNFYHAADNKGVGERVFLRLLDHGWANKKTVSPIHMPRWASRISLEVTGVRVERLNDISVDDALAEGVLSWREQWDQKQAATAMLLASVSKIRTKSDDVALWLFHQLWESIHGFDSWLKNPWVWVIEFKRIEQQTKGAPE